MLDLNNFFDKKTSTQTNFTMLNMAIAIVHTTQQPARVADNTDNEAKDKAC